MNALDNDFEGWSADESKHLSKQLLRVIRQGDLYAIAHAVVISDFIEIYPDVAEDPKGWVYQHAMTMCLRRIGVRFGVHIPKPLRSSQGIAVFFDQTKAFEARASKAYNLVTQELKSEYQDCFNSIDPGDSRSLIALQTADLLAYEIMRELTRKLFSSSKDMRVFFEKMVKGRKVQVEATYSDKQYFKDMKESARKNRKIARLLP